MIGDDRRVEEKRKKEDIRGGGVTERSGEGEERRGEEDRKEKNG